jgi:hypothetical protein
MSKNREHERQAAPLDRAQPVFKTLWIGELGRLEQLCCASFLKHGHPLEIYAYEELPGLPSGVRLMDAAAIMKFELRDRFAYDGQASLAAFSDAFRYELLARTGGIWIDLDVVCLTASPTIDAPYLFPCTTTGVIVDADDEEFGVDSWFIRAPADSPFLGYCAEACRKAAGTSQRWGALGPTLVTRAVREFQLESAARDDIFFPVNWNRIELFIDGSAQASRLWEDWQGRAQFLHLYRNMWRHLRIDAGASHPPNSIYERLKRLFL